MPTQTLRIHVGRGLSPESIAEVLRDNYELHGFIIGDVTQHDMRAEYCADSFRLLSVERGECRGAYILEYSYEWSAYYGCRDMCKGDTEHAWMNFRYWNGELIFRKVVVEPRSTVDEF